MSDNINIRRQEAEEFIDVILNRRLDEFANKLHSDLVNVMNRDVDIFIIDGNPPAALLIRTGVELSKLAGIIAAMCAIQTEAYADPQSKENLGSCMEILTKLFQTSIKIQADLMLKKHLK